VFGKPEPEPVDDFSATVRKSPYGTLVGSHARHEEHVMNTSAVDTIVIELSDEYLPAEVLNAWAERHPDSD
jgi:hypothetical protein